MMKILQVTTVATTINAFLLPFTKKFKQQGWQVDAAASNVKDFDSVIAEHDTCFDICFCRNPLKLKQLYHSLKKIRRLLKKQQYDVVHIHTPIAAFLTRFAAIGIKNTKIFYTAHGFHYINTNPTWKNVIFYIAEKLAGFNTEHLFVINRDDFLFAKNKRIVPENKLTFIHGIGVDPDNYQFNEYERFKLRSELGLSDNTFMLLQVAELNINKNHQIVLQALAKFKQANPSADFRYVIVGEGSLKLKLQQLVKELNLINFVTFLGQRNNISALLSACDVLTLSSKREGLPRCMLEAMCISKSIIASQIRGCTDLLSGGAGILVDYDNADKWAEAIKTLYLNSQKRSAMAAIGKQLIQDKYQENKVVDAVLAVYKKELFQ